MVVVKGSARSRLNSRAQGVGESSVVGCRPIKDNVDYSCRKDNLTCYTTGMTKKCFTCSSQSCSFLPERLPFDTTKYHELLGNLEGIARSSGSERITRLLLDCAQDLRSLL
jgi:hypothetical protein